MICGDTCGTPGYAESWSLPMISGYSTHPGPQQVDSCPSPDHSFRRLTGQHLLGRSGVVPLSHVLPLVMRRFGRCSWSKRYPHCAAETSNLRPAYSLLRPVIWLDDPGQVTRMLVPRRPARWLSGGSQVCRHLTRPPPLGGLITLYSLFPARVQKHDTVWIQICFRFTYDRSH